MIKAIIFDFDGVLIESAHIKTDAFRKLFSYWPVHVDEMLAYHMKNMGISRYVKFKHFYETMLKQPYTDEIGSQLSSRFSLLVLDEIKRAPLVAGTVEFLTLHQQQYKYFIASGTPQEELEDIVVSQNLTQFFSGIFGSPVTKVQIIKNILAEYSVKKNECMFVGDAESDRNAAQETEIRFVLRITGENMDIAEQTQYKIADLAQLDGIIEEMGS